MACKSMMNMTCLPLTYYAVSPISFYFQNTKHVLQPLRSFAFSGSFFIFSSSSYSSYHLSLSVKVISHIFSILKIAFPATPLHFLNLVFSQYLLPYEIILLICLLVYYLQFVSSDQMISSIRAGTFFFFSFIYQRFSLTLCQVLSTC